MAADHSTIQTFPTSRWVALHATAGNGTRVTLPTAERVRISILSVLQSDRATATTGVVSFDQALADGAAIPAIADGVERVNIAAGGTLVDIVLGPNKTTRATYMHIAAGSNAAFALVSYDAPGEYR